MREPAREYLADARLVDNRRFALLIFTTVLVMWYLLAMLGYVLKGFGGLQLHWAILATVLLAPPTLNSITWIFFLFFSGQQQTLRRQVMEYDMAYGSLKELEERRTGDFRLEYRLMKSGRVIDLLAIGQIIYIWLSFMYVILLAAEATVRGLIGSG